MKKTTKLRRLNTDAVLTFEFGAEIPQFHHSSESFSDVFLGYGLSAYVTLSFFFVVYYSASPKWILKKHLFVRFIVDSLNMLRFKPRADNNGLLVVDKGLDHAITLISNFE